MCRSSGREGPRSSKELPTEKPLPKEGRGWESPDSPRAVESAHEIHPELECTHFEVREPSLPCAVLPTTARTTAHAAMCQLPKGRCYYEMQSMHSWVGFGSGIGLDSS